MKPKNIVAIFAHPDDEAFGPAGTLALFAKTRNVYIICATNGAAGEGKEFGKNKIAKIRRNELFASARILGIKKVYFLNFEDGTLSNNLYHTLAVKIEPILKRLKPEIIVTFEPRGISGHIDHIVVSLVSSFLFEKLKFIKQLYYCCKLKKGRAKKSDYFVYVPPGYSESEIQRKVDISSVLGKKISAIKEHRSQRNDVIRVLPMIAKGEKKEYFLILKK